jgi:hypothetical protein
MKTKKAYGLWHMLEKKLESWSVRDSFAAVSDNAAFELQEDWADLRSKGYRVIPVTITYEEPEK